MMIDDLITKGAPELYRMSHLVLNIACYYVPITQINALLKSMAIGLVPKQRQLAWNQKKKPYLATNLLEFYPLVPKS